MEELLTAEPLIGKLLAVASVVVKVSLERLVNFFAKHHIQLTMEGG